MGITHSSGIRGLPECERLPSGEFRPVVQGKNTRTAHISPHCRPCAQPRHRRADNIGERGRVRPRTPPQHLATWELQDALTKRAVAADKPLKKLAANFKYASATIRESLLHSYSKRFERRYRDMFDISDSYWLLCQGYADRLARLLGVESDNPKIKVMPNPADTGRFMPLANCEKKKEVLFVGRLTYADKRVDRLLRIWAEVSKQNPDWSLHIVGDGKDRPNLEKLAGELALKNITFHGYRDPAPHYESASVLCMTSTFEGWPQVLVEAMSSGVVPIAFGCTDGVREILGDGRGVLVEGFDEKAYAAELHRLLQDRQGLEQRRALYPAYAAQFDCGTIAELWHESISLLMGPHSARNDC